MTNTHSKVSVINTRHNTKFKLEMLRGPYMNNQIEKFKGKLICMIRTYHFIWIGHIIEAIRENFPNMKIPDLILFSDEITENGLTTSKCVINDNIIIYKSKSDVKDYKDDDNKYNANIHLYIGPLNQNLEFN